MSADVLSYALVLALLSPLPVPATAPGCPTGRGTLSAAEVSGVNVLRCGLIGRAVTEGPVGALIPAPGEGVSAARTATDGGEILDLLTDPGGILNVTVNTAAGALPIGADAGCRDRTEPAVRPRAARSVSWRLNLGGGVRGLAERSIERAIAAGARNLSTGRNDCGVRGKPGFEVGYDGRTSASTHISADSGCGGRPGSNVVDVGTLRGETSLGFTCTWWRGDRFWAHMRFARDARWTTNPNSLTCAGRYDLEGVATHEWGHAAGLQHAPGRHPWLTMAPAIKPCSGYARTFSAGEAAVLRRAYPIS
ncbi:hypothetical protein D5S17_15475 [Pseudonocardiaceae bacterium YIM PH 21723]|nr:hypothetical protein D5S17_15475 [Pseudonocardiaceae bacterium YIM PH 21723]